MFGCPLFWNWGLSLFGGWGLHRFAARASASWATRGPLPQWGGGSPTLGTLGYWLLCGRGHRRFGAPVSDAFGNPGPPPICSGALLRFVTNTASAALGHGPPPLLKPGMPTHSGWGPPPLCDHYGIRRFGGGASSFCHQSPPFWVHRHLRSFGASALTFFGEGAFYDLGPGLPHLRNTRTLTTLRLGLLNIGKPMAHATRGKALCRFENPRPPPLLRKGFRLFAITGPPATPGRGSPLLLVTGVAIFLQSLWYLSLLGYGPSPLRQHQASALAPLWL